MKSLFLWYSKRFVAASERNCSINVDSEKKNTLTFFIVRVSGKCFSTAFPFAFRGEKKRRRRHGGEKTRASEREKRRAEERIPLRL